MIHLAQTTRSVKKPAKKEAPAPVAVVEEEQVITEGIVAVDNGGVNTKVFTEDMDKPIVIDSRKAYGHNNFRMQSNSYPEGTYKIKWKGKHYFFGWLMNQSRRKLSGYTTTKSTDYFILSVLQSCALYGYDVNFVLTNTPISRYSDEEIELITNRLVGEHELEINDVMHKFTIDQVIVAPETSIASYFHKPIGIHRWLDLGSRTVGYASTIGDEFGNFTPMEGEDEFSSPSGTIEKEGLDIRNVLDKDGDELKSYLVEYVENIYNHLSPIWEDDDPVTAFGGGALVPELIEELQKRYINLAVDEDPLTLQVRSMLNYAIENDIFQLEDVEYVEEE